MYNFKRAIIKIYFKKLNQKVKNIVNVTHGHENFVFIVKTNKQVSIIRIPKENENSVFGGVYQIWREKWVSELLSELNLPVPKIITIDDRRKIANFDYVIETFEPGIELNKLKLEEKEYKDIMQQIGVYLKKIHQIKTKKYGLLVKKRVGEFSEWSSVINNEINKIINNLRDLNLLDKRMLLQIIDFFKQRREVLIFNKPCLLHNDINPSNILVRNNNISAIIDFGDAFSGDFIYDVARTYQGLYGLPNLNAFLKAYGQIDEMKFNYYFLFHLVSVLVYFKEINNYKQIKNYIKVIKKIINNEHVF